MRLTTFLLLMGFLLSNCKKDGNSGDSEPPLVSITSPTNLASFSAGQKLPVMVSVSDNNKVASIHLNIEGPDFIHLAYGESGKTRSISEEIPVSKKGKYILSVEAHDAAGNKGTAKVDISVN